MRYLACILIILHSFHKITGQELMNGFNILVFQDSTELLKATDVADMLNKNEVILSLPDKIPEKLSSKINYWLILKPQLVDTSQDYLFTINDRLSRVEAYNYPYTELSAIAGISVPGSEKDLFGDKLILKHSSHPQLVKIENKLQSLVYFKTLKVVPYSNYLSGRAKKIFFYGIIQGFFILILIYNILLFIVAKQRIYLYFVIYILLNALLLTSYHEFSEKFLFPNTPYLNQMLLSLQIIGVFFYLLFLRNSMLNHCSDYTKQKDKYILLPMAYTALVLNLLISSTLFFRLDLFSILSRLSNLIVSVICIVLFSVFYKKSDKFLRIVMHGSLLLILMGYINIVLTLFKYQTEMFYVSGLLIELILFTYALNDHYFKEIFIAKYRNHVLENELEIKNRELLNQALQLTSRETVLSSVKNKLKAFNTEKNKHQIYSELEMTDRIDKVMWSDFNKHFNSIHPEFYRNIVSNYPLLSQNEIRLCAFLKLNLNTKEIAAITQKSIHSIETMRSRIRHKLNLQRDNSLSNFLLQQ
ncbi:MAG: 7TM-DISM domain-containing protein [Bacteroidales bacterium]|nr:7TM-DISM domain-containing protein [Bacteroidales bacterium]MBN2820773.1 7TM-DISM domain-containing protein [Bacteroidales bacterium]